MKNVPLRSGEYFLGFSFFGESRFFWRRKQRAAFHLLRINGGGEEEGGGGQGPRGVGRRHRCVEA